MSGRAALGIVGWFAPEDNGSSHSKFWKLREYIHVLDLKKWKNIIFLKNYLSILNSLVILVSARFFSCLEIIL